MIDAQPVGQHMTMAVFRKTLAFVERMCLPIPMLLLTGGEPTENPLLPEFISDALAHGFGVTVLSNGTFLEDPELTRKLLHPPSDKVRFFVTNDPRYYPRRVPQPDLPGVAYADDIGDVLAPFGRAKDNPSCTRKYPMCFNIRSATRSTGDIRQAVGMLQLRVKMCSPSINHDGSIVMGETTSCLPIGTVEDSPQTLTERLLQASCNRCGLASNLSAVQRNAIQGL
jgi:hypothetical protein